MSGTLKKGICPECNQEIEVDSSKDAVICEYCENPISVKKSIGKYAMAHKEEFAREATEGAINKGKQAAENVTGFAFGVADSIRGRKAEKERKAREERERQLEVMRIEQEKARVKSAERRAKTKAWISEHKKIVIGIAIAFAVLIVIGTINAAYEEAHDTRLKVPAGASSLCAMNYEAAKQELEDAGFTNITLEPKYDVVLGIFSSVGDVESISIDGKASFSSDSKFDADVPIVITYHLSISDDPSLDDSSQSSDEYQTDNAGLPEVSEYAKRAAVVMWSNMAAEDVWDDDGNTRIPEKLHSYSDMSGNLDDYFVQVEGWGNWTTLAKNKWKVEGINLRRDINNVVFKNRLNMVVTYDPTADNYVISNLEYTDVDKRNRLSPFPDEDSCYIVPSSLVAEDRDEAAASALDKSGDIEEYQAMSMLKKYGKSVFPYGFKLHDVLGVRAADQKADGSWYLEVEATVTNEYNAKRDVIVYAYINNKTQAVEDFRVKDK